MSTKKYSNTTCASHLRFFIILIVLKDTSNLIIATTTTPNVKTSTELLEPNEKSEETKDEKNSDKIFECTVIYD